MLNRLKDVMFIQKRRYIRKWDRDIFWRRKGKDKQTNLNPPKNKQTNKNSSARL